MKITVGFLLFMLLTICVACSNSKDEIVDQPSEDTRTDGMDDTDYSGYYWFGGEKISLRKIEGKYYVVFFQADERKIREEFARTGATLSEVYELGNFSMFVAEGKEYSGAKKFANLMAAFVEGDYKKNATALTSTLYWSPFYEGENKTEIKVTPLFTVVLKPGTDFTELEKLAKENAVEIIGEDVNNPKWIHLACTNLSKGNALVMANLFYDSNLFEAAFPDFIAGQLAYIHE